MPLNKLLKGAEYTEETGFDFSHQMCSALSHIFDVPDFLVQSINRIENEDDQLTYLKRFQKESIDRDMFDNFVAGHGYNYGEDLKIKKRALMMYGFNEKFITNLIIGCSNKEQLQYEINQNIAFKRDLTIITL